MTADLRICRIFELSQGEGKMVGLDAWVSWFLAAYTITFLLSGRIVPLIGTLLGLAVFVGWWSISNALTGLASSAASLHCFRFLLGLGEAGGSYCPGRSLCNDLQYATFGVYSW